MKTIKGLIRLHHMKGLAALFALVTVVPFVTMAQGMPPEANNILSQVLGPSGHLDKALYDQFWAQFKNQPEHEVDQSINWIKGSLLVTQEYETELWKCALLSYDNQRVVKTDRLLQLEKEAPTMAKDSIPWPPGTPQYNEALSAYNSSEQASMENARRLLDAAAHHQSLVGANGKNVTLDRNVINQALSSISASFSRLTELLDKDWNGGVGSIANDESGVCLSDICLGQSIRTLTHVAWLPLSEVPEHTTDLQNEFPDFQSIDDIYTTIPPISFGISASAEGLLVDIVGVKSKKLLLKDSRYVRNNILAVGPRGLAIMSGSNVVFCSDVWFVAYFRSSSGHASAVGFSPVIHGDGTTDLVVRFIGRRFIAAEEVSSSLEKELRLDFPYLASLKCQSETPGFGMNPGYPGDLNCGSGDRRAPYYETIYAKKAGRRFVELYDPSYGYADLILQTFEDSRPRFGAKAQNKNPACPVVTPVVPSVE